MSFDPNSLKPRQFSDDDVCNYIRSQNKKEYKNSLVLVDKIGRNKAKFETCGIVFALLAEIHKAITKETHFVENKEDLCYTPEFCGKEQYEEYKNALSDASDITYYMQSIVDGFLDSYEGFSRFVNRNDIKTIPQLITTMVSQMDVALSWMCYLLNKDPTMRLDSILFQEKNPLRPLISGVKGNLKSMEPFNHIYVTNNGKDFQKAVLKATEENVFINYPKIIVFASEDGKTIEGDFPDFVALPMKLSKKAFTDVVERCDAWKKTELPEAEQVIEKYQKTFDLKYYKLGGFVNYYHDDNIYAAVVNKEYTKFSKRSYEEKPTPVCVFYTLDEE